MLTVYVAGPLSSGLRGTQAANSGSITDYIKNCHRMIAEANRLRLQGFAPFVPCLDYLLGVVNGTMEYGDYYAPSQEWLKRSDAVYVIARSPGVDKEIGLALSLNIPCFNRWYALLAWQAAQQQNSTQDRVSQQPQSRDPHYETLRIILQAAYERSVYGKGRERHGEDLPIEKQQVPLINAAEDGGLARGQIKKKLDEMKRMNAADAIMEGLDVIVYAAFEIMRLKGLCVVEESQSPVAGEGEV